jgi:hypothetical protein
MKNTGYTIVAKSPLLRPGLEITMGPVSEKYLVEETRKLLDYVRRINEGDPNAFSVPLTGTGGDITITSDGAITIATEKGSDNSALHIPAGDSDEDGFYFPSPGKYAVLKEFGMTDADIARLSSTGADLDKLAAILEASKSKRTTAEKAVGDYVGAIPRVGGVI